MSVLVRGMKMPKSCIDCPIYHGGFCLAVVEENGFSRRVDDGNLVKRGNPERAEWCPLVYVED